MRDDTSYTQSVSLRTPMCVCVCVCVCCWSVKVLPVKVAVVGDVDKKLTPTAVPLPRVGHGERAGYVAVSGDVLVFDVAPARPLLRLSIGQVLEGTCGVREGVRGIGGWRRKTDAASRVRHTYCV